MAQVLLQTLITHYKNDLPSEERILFKDKAVYQIGFMASLEQELVKFPGMSGINDWLNEDKNINLNKIDEFIELFKNSSQDTQQIYRYFLREETLFRYLPKESDLLMKMNYVILNDFYRKNLDKLLLNDELKDNLVINKTITQQKI